MILEEKRAKALVDIAILEIELDYELYKKNVMLKEHMYLKEGYDMDTINEFLNVAQDLSKGVKIDVIKDGIKKELKRLKTKDDVQEAIDELEYLLQMLMENKYDPIDTKMYKFVNKTGIILSWVSLLAFMLFPLGGMSGHIMFLPSFVNRIILALSRLGTMLIGTLMTVMAPLFNHNKSNVESSVVKYSHMIRYIRVIIKMLKTGKKDFDFKMLDKV